MEVVLIVNPFASAVSESRVRDVERELGAVASVRTLFTERPGHATKLAAEVAGEDALVAFSGDGGFNEVLNGVQDGVPLGFLPGGGTSVLPRALGLPRNPVAAARRVAEALEQGRRRRISLGRVNGRRFSFSAGIGLDAELVRRVDALGRRDDGRRPGDAAYLRAALRFVTGRRGRFEPALEVRGLGRAAFALVANTDPYTYAGRVPVHVAPEATFELGLDVVAPVRSGRSRYRGSCGTCSPVTAGTTSSTATIWTGSRSPVTGRCRSRPTARISATSRKRSSKPSATPLTCSSRVSL